MVKLINPSLPKVVVLSYFAVLIGSFCSVVSATEIRIGVLAVHGAERALQMWQPTASYLSEQIEGYSFSIVPVSNNDIEAKIADKSLHFTLTNPVLYASLENTQGISRIATLKTKQLGQAYTEFGAVVFTRADKHDIGSFSDLENKSFMAVHPMAFGGWLMSLYEFRKSGIEPHEFFSEIKWAGFPQDNIVFEVLSGKVDAGTVRTNIIERLAFAGKINLSDVRVLNAKSEPGFPFLLSTQLYPEWAFAKVKETPLDVAELVAIVLLSLPGDSSVAMAANSDGWTVPLDYQPIHKLMRKLQVGPYKALNQGQNGGLLNESSRLILVLLVVFMAAFVLSVMRGRRTRKIKLQLQSQLDVHAVEKTHAADELDTHNILFKKQSTIINMQNVSPREKLSQLLTLGCELCGVEHGSVDKMDHVAGKFCVLEQVLRNEKVLNIVNHDVFNEAKQLLIARAFEAEQVLSLQDLNVTEREELLPGTQCGVHSYFGSAIFVDGHKYGVLSLVGVSDVINVEQDASNEWRFMFIQHLGYLVGQLIEKEMLMQRYITMQKNDDLDRVG